VTSPVNTVTALVPIRHDSQRVPGKNYRPFAGQPLYRWIIHRLLEVESVQAVVIDTDSPTVRADCMQTFGASVRLLDRPPELCAPDISMNRILAHDLDHLGDGYYLQTHATNPLLTTATIRTALERFFAALERGDCDSLFSVTERRVRLWTGAGEPLNHNPGELLQTQDLPPFFEENSCLYLFSAEGFRQHANRIGKRPLLFPIPALEAVDIDEEADFLLAESLALLQQSNPI
jgi:CMP-N-acetylneuraminic acid synthetase